MKTLHVQNYNYTQSNSFKGYHPHEYKKGSTSGLLIHESYFYRDPITDSFVENYILTHIKSDRKMNVVSAGCSAGEELYSIAAKLDYIQDRLNLEGFDLSEEIINEAKNGIYELTRYEDYFINDSANVEHRAQFYKYFLPVRYKQVGNFYKMREDAFPNCKFFTGDVSDIDKYYEKDSVDVLLFRNVLYHLTCDFGDDLSQRNKKENSSQITNSLAQKMASVVRKEGLVVLGEDDYFEGGATKEFESAMLQNGFEPVYLRSSAMYQKNFNPEIHAKTHVYKKVS
ncbi:hypothetical protein IJ531_02005 [bacterium]|nr:hypothetical protein [bacterium]